MGSMEDVSRRPLTTRMRRTVVNGSGTVAGLAYGFWLRELTIDNPVMLTHGNAARLVEHIVDIRLAGTVMVRVGSTTRLKFNGVEADNIDNVSIDEARQRKMTHPAADVLDSNRRPSMAQDRSRRLGLTSKIVQHTTDGKKLTSWHI